MVCHSFASDDTAEPSRKSIDIIFASATNVRSAYLRAVKNKPCNELIISESSFIHRGALEMILACRAFYAAGVVPNITIVPSPNYSRALRMVEAGTADIAAETIWLDDIDTSRVYYSNAILRSGEFEKGLYARVGHTVFSLAPEDIKIESYNAVTVRNWHNDKQALEDFTKNIFYSPRYSSIYNMLRAGRADFTLLAFPTNLNLLIEADELSMMPIPNVKVKFSGSRHFVVSRMRPKSKELNELLNQGLNALRLQGEIEKFLLDAGVINKKTKDWKILNQWETQEKK